VAVTALVFFAAGGVLALLIRTQFLQPGTHVLSEQTYNEVFTMHGSTMIYLFVTPIALALGVYLVPLQVGASDIAAPRVASLGSWLLIAGGVTMWAGWLTKTGPGTDGWTAFDPLSDNVYTPGIGMNLWIVGVIAATIAAILLAACVLATITHRRAPGMTMLRLPVFSWSMLVTCLMTLASFPVLVLAMSLLFAQRELGHVFDGSHGAIDYRHLFWFYGHPVVYVMFFPFIGAVAEVIAVFSRKRFFGYRSLVLSLLVFTALSMSVWAHHMFTTDQVTNRYFSLTSTLLLIPGGIEYFDMLATMWRGSIRLATPMLFALAFVVQFLIGGLSGIFIASPPLDYHVHQSFTIVAHFHYTLFAGSIFGFFAGFYYWFPKVAGIHLRERLGKLHFWLLALGTNLAFFPMFFLGYDGMARRVSYYTAASGFQGLNVVASIGSYVIAIAMVVLVANLLWSVSIRRAAEPDPWQGHTLEWATSSPPPRHNFVDPLPEISSYAPLLDARERAAAAGAVTA
jgi:cytochrome c oxidase subunit 1